MPRCRMLRYVLFVVSYLVAVGYALDRGPEFWREAPLLSKWPYAVGFLYAVVLSSYPIRCLLRKLHKAVGDSKGHLLVKNPKPRWMSAMVGHVEATLYLSAIVIDKWEFIPIWLGLKVVITWKTSSSASTPASMPPPPTASSQESDSEHERCLLGIFLIGSACSLVYSVVGAHIIKLIQEGDHVMLFSFLLLPPIGTFILITLTWYYERTRKGEDKPAKCQHPNETNESENL